MGPRASAGKKLSAPTSSTMRMSRNTKRASWVGSVPALTATAFFSAREPAMARVAHRGTKRTNSITRPMDTFKKGVLALKPAKAEPLLPPAEE